MTQIILASASPRRRELLHQIGLVFTVHAVDLDETPRPDEAAHDYVRRLAVQKAQAAQTELQTTLPVLGADTSVLIDGKILGKPKDKNDGLDMLARLSGRTHTVLSAVAIVQDKRQALALNESQVTFRNLDETQRLAYWHSGEPADKAGAYAIQGQGATLVKTLHGSHSGVMGLPLYETAELLQQFGIDILQM